MSRLTLLLALLLVLTGGGFLDSRLPSAAWKATPVLPSTLNQSQSGEPGGSAISPGGRQGPGPRPVTRRRLPSDR
jgi:hypothetical protein